MASEPEDYFSEAFARLRREDASAFKDAGVVRAYRNRPPYPEDLFQRLSQVCPTDWRRVLDLGCGTGDISRRLARYVDHIDAIDVSAEMVATARTLAGAGSRIAGHVMPVEEFDGEGTYGLAVAAESIAWFDLPRLLPRLRSMLHPEGLLALVTRLELAAWSEGFSAIIPEFAASKSFRRRNIVAEMEAAGLATLVREETLGPWSFTQSVDDYIELQHSRQSFARNRMGGQRAREFDDQLREIVERHARDGRLTYDFSVSLAFLQPA